MSIDKLKNKFELTIKEIVKEFEKKQELQFEFFVCDDFTGVACFDGIHYFSLEDICHDVFTEQPKGQIIDLLYQSLDNEDQKIFIQVNKHTIENGNAELLMCEARDYLESVDSKDLFCELVNTDI